MKQPQAYRPENLHYLKMLARQYPTVQEASTEIINLRAIQNLPKGTEHFLSDVHGEYEAFQHIINSASGVVREKIDELLGSSVPRSDRDQLATLIYYPQEKLEEIVRNYAANFGFTDRNTSLQDLLNMMGVDAAAIRPSAEMQVKTDLLLDAVAEAENAEITEEETEEYLKRVAEGIGAKPEDIKNYFSKEFIEAEMKKERATNAIIESAVEAKAE